MIQSFVDIHISMTHTILNEILTSLYMSRNRSFFFHQHHTHLEIHIYSHTLCDVSQHVDRFTNCSRRILTSLKQHRRFKRWILSVNETQTTMFFQTTLHAFLILTWLNESDEKLIQHAYSCDNKISNITFQKEMFVIITSLLYVKKTF